MSPAAFRDHGFFVVFPCPRMELPDAELLIAPDLRLSGELDLPTQAASRAALHPWVTGLAERVILDTSAVTFIDCAGLRPVREAAAALAARGARLLLPSPSPVLMRLVTLTGVSEGLFLAADQGLPWKAGGDGPLLGGGPGRGPAADGAA